LESLVALFAVSALSLVAFGAAGAALAGLRGTCSRACDREGRPLCERCPRRNETGATRAAHQDPLQDEAPSGAPPGGAR
jgi:hypothetical protein